MKKIEKISEKIQDKPKKTIRTGNTIKVHFKIKEGEKSRIQVFEGIVIAKHREDSPDATITVRRVTGGYGVERIFPINSPLIEKIEIVKIATKIRQSKIFYLRDRKGKKARLKEDVLNENINITNLKEEIKTINEEDKEIEKKEEILDLKEEKKEEEKKE
jgi:large subunit ribosomal protein L19